MANWFNISLKFSKLFLYKPLLFLHFHSILKRFISSKSWSSLPSKASHYDALPDSLKSEVLVRARVETPEIQAERAETVKTKTVAELSQINSLAEFPLPKPIENLIHTDLKIEKLFERPG